MHCGSKSEESHWKERKRHKSRGGTPGNLGVGESGVSRPVLQTLTLFRTKNVIFHTRFQTRSVKSTPIFRPGLLDSSRLSDSEGKLPVSQFSGRPNYLGAWNRLGLIRQKSCHRYQIRVQTKNSSNAIRIRIYLFRSYFFKIWTINTFIHVHFRSSPRSRSKWAKCFQTKKAQKPYSLGRHIPIWLI